MSAASPLVTVVVPTFNEPVHILRASLESLRAQTFADFECIVVDESTNDHLVEECRKICAEDSRFIHIRPSTRIGLAGSLNLAIETARGKLIARFDSDDVCVPSRLALQVSFLEKNPNISVVGGGLSIVDDHGSFIADRLYPESSHEISRGMQLSTTLAHPTVMYRKSTVDMYGAYATDFASAEDLELWLRWMNFGVHFANIPEVLVFYRQNNTHRKNRHWRYNLRARIRNFSSNFLMHRILGILCITVWIALPQKVQEKIFSILFLRRHRQVSHK